MALKKWISDEAKEAASIPGPTDDRRRLLLEGVADDLILRATAAIAHGGVWNFSPATRAAEEEIHALYVEFIAGGGGGIAALTAAIERWRMLGTTGGQIQERGFIDEHS